MAFTKFFKHPSYDERNAQWQVYKDFYEGKKEVMTSQEYLIAHEIEGTGEGARLRLIREQRTEYTNYIKPYIKRFVSLIFKKDPDFAEVKDKVFTDDGEFENVDGCGTPFDDFIKRKIAENYFLYGKIGIYIDSDKVQVETEAERQQAGLRPYFELIEPQAIKDWEYIKDRTQNINMLKFATHEYTLVASREDATTEPKKVKYLRQYLIDNGKFLVETYKAEKKQDTKTEDWVLDDSTTLPLDFIPLLILDNESWVKDTVPKARELLNTESVLSNIHLNQAHQRIFFTGNIQADANGKYAAGEGNVIVLNGEGNITIAQPADTASLERRRDQILNDMIKITFLQTRHLPASSGAGESWETIREAKEDFRAVAINAAKDIESLVNQSLKAYSAFKGIELKEDLVSFDKDITVEDVNEFIQWVAAFNDRITKYPTWNKEIDIEVASRMNLKNADDILAEIKEAPLETPAQDIDPLEQLLNGGQVTGTEAVNTQSNQG